MGSLMVNCNIVVHFTMELPFVITLKECACGDWRCDAYVD